MIRQRILQIPIALLVLLLSACGFLQAPGAAAIPEVRGEAATVVVPPAPPSDGVAAAGGVALQPTLTQPPATEIPAPEPATPLPATPTQPPVEPTPVPVEPSPLPGPRLVQLTSGGCCTQPFFSSDSSTVRYIDRPSADLPVGIWEVPVSAPGSEPRFVSGEIAALSRQGDYQIEAGAESARVTRISDGQAWEVPTGGDTPHVSPDGTRVAWDIRNFALPFEQQVAEIWVATLGRGDERMVYRLPRGGVRGWLGNDALLLNGRDSPEGEIERLLRLSLVDGSVTELAASDRMSGETLSPGGSWVVYFTSQSVEPARNGIWLVATGGSPPRQLASELFGSYRWRDDGHLLLVPLRASAAAHELLEIEAATGVARPLTDPATLPFKIANGDWTVSPDGRYVVLVESRDDNLWLIDLR